MQSPTCLGYDTCALAIMTSAATSATASMRGRGCGRKKWGVILPAGKLEFRFLYFFDFEILDLVRCFEPTFAPNFAARTSPPNCDLALTCLRLFSWLASRDMYAYGIGFPCRITSPRPRCTSEFGPNRSLLFITERHDLVTHL